MISGLLSDLIGDEQELLAPLRHLVGLPGFNVLLKRARSGTGLHERDALLQTIAQTYSSPVVVALGQFLDGLLGLQEGSAQASQSIPAKTTQPQCVGPKPNGSANPSHPQSSYSSTAMEGGSQPKRSFFSLLVLGVVTALVTATAAVAIRSGALCSVGIACPPGSSLDVLQGVDAAAKASQEMETATSLAAYGQALAILEAHLSDLRVMEGSAFTAEQTHRLARLQTLATEGRSRLAAEQLNQARIQQLNTEVDSLSHLEPGQELQSRLAQAASSLGSINPKSFSYAKAKELQTRLNSLLGTTPYEPGSSQVSGEDPAAGNSAASNPSDRSPASPSVVPKPEPPSPGDSSRRSEPLF